LNTSTMGSGLYSFIPDAKIVGTNFVNAIANAVTTLSQNAKLHLFPLGGSTISEGNLPSYIEKINNEYVAKLGNLQYGQGRDLVIPMNISSSQSDYLAIMLEYDDQDGVTRKVSYIANSLNPTKDSLAALVRHLVVTETYLAILDFANGKSFKAMKAIKDLSDRVTAFDIETENSDPRINGLFADLVGMGELGGRMTKAVSTIERFNRWGQHYLRSITRSHHIQLRTNFIDVGLQVYGGPTFVNQQDEGGKIFIQLPMVMSKQPRYDNFANIQNNNAAVNNPPPPIDNTVYYGGGGGGCFHESCFVNVMTSEGKEVKTILSKVKKGDKVIVIDNGMKNFAQVICVIKINLDQNERLIEFPSTGLKITKKHPIWLNNKWQLPIDIANNSNLAKIIEKSSNVVYNFILEHSHVLIVNDMECVTLGHGIKEAFHPFYGTSEVIDVIKKSSGYENGFVQVNSNIRNLAI